MDWTSVLTSLGVAGVVGAGATYFFNRLNDARGRIERLETDLMKSRDEAYGQIWNLTGALNLFGPAHPVHCANLSGELTNWYFSKGQMLTEDSKLQYFLVQEVLNFLRLRGISPCRPSDELLYSGEERTIDAVRARRAERLAVEAKTNEGSYTFEELAACVDDFKSTCNPSREEVSENAWLLLQFVMSAFRSRVTKELGSRVAMSSPP